jgi:16S rRNA (guanine966-N2)-methyltransferase
MKKPSLTISAGKFKRAHIPLAKQHRQHQNSTTARVKEAAFQLIRNRVDLSGEWLFYDLFAGSGQMGIEALSRGACHATFVDIVPERLSEIQRALAALFVPRDTFTLVRARAIKVLPDAFAHADLPSVIWADPPYTYAGSPSSDPAILIALYRTTLAENPQIKTRPLLIIQVHEKNPALAPQYLEANPDLEIYRYGSNCLLLLA